MAFCLHDVIVASPLHLHAVFITSLLHLTVFTVAEVSAEVAHRKHTETIAQLGHMLWPNLAAVLLERACHLLCLAVKCALGKEETKTCNRPDCAHGLMHACADVALGDHKESIAELGHLLWPKLAAAYIEQRLSPAVPHDEAGLDAFQSLAKAAERLEGEATAIGCNSHLNEPIAAHSCFALFHAACSEA